MWLVVRYRYGCSPEVVAMFNHCCQAMQRAAQLCKEFPEDRFYPRWERNYHLRRSIDDITSDCSWRTKKRATRKLDKNSLRR
ncbi:hypothetical protein MiSe_94600 [Microseira wollei NIES-4236]|uniref:Transposase n=1 Tax=Microseira wollei NIES-4236 TaxID=2530354 RepID=A0AAV3XPY0_9CYAN|nr:hypothetical protein MiSe_94600 [Microseira wollei NIES-4236]